MPYFDLNKIQPKSRFKGKEHQKFPNKKYQIIYADPPWSYNKTIGKGVAVDQYPTMSDENILKLEVSKISDVNCALFLWATFPNLPLGIKVVESWGFRYVTDAFIWVKRYPNSKWVLGLGHYTRGNAEVCLLGIKGKIKRKSKIVSSVLDNQRTTHSKKPNEARSRIIQLLGDLPRIELFARKRWSGWDSWGNEI